MPIAPGTQLGPYQILSALGVIIQRVVDADLDELTVVLNWPLALRK